MIFFFISVALLHEVMKKWLATAKPDNRGESLRALQDLCKGRITSVADTYFTDLWGVGGSQGRGEPRIEYRDRQKAKEVCVKTFVEKYDMVTSPSGRKTQKIHSYWRVCITNTSGGTRRPDIVP